MTTVIYDPIICSDVNQLNMVPCAYGLDANNYFEQTDINIKYIPGKW